MRARKSPSSAGIVPSSALLVRRSWVTRGGVSATVMPSHAVMAIPSAQFRVAVPRSVSLSPSNVVQSATKPAKSGVPVTAPVTATLSAVQVVCAPAPSGSARTSNNRTLATPTPRGPSPGPGRGPSPGLFPCPSCHLLRSGLSVIFSLTLLPVREPFRPAPLRTRSTARPLKRLPVCSLSPVVVSCRPPADVFSRVGHDHEAHLPLKLGGFLPSLGDKKSSKIK